MKIEMELRPCLVDGEKALFHKWGTKIEYISNGLHQPYGTHEATVGIIEYDNGNVATVHPSKIKFIDCKHSQYIWY